MLCLWYLRGMSPGKAKGWDSQVGEGREAGNKCRNNTTQGSPGGNVRDMQGTGLTGSQESRTRLHSALGKALLDSLHNCCY